jgi:hypothetical protein
MMSFHLLHQGRSLHGLPKKRPLPRALLPHSRKIAHSPFLLASAAHRRTAAFREATLELRTESRRSTDKD